VEGENVEFRKVKQTEERVYVLEFKESKKKLFFWMQEVFFDRGSSHIL
jgi:hypothetical protein